MAAVMDRDLLHIKRTIQQNNLLTHRQINQIRTMVDFASHDNREKVEQPGQSMKRKD